MDTVRVLRIIEYVGPRDLIEKQIERSIHGTRRFGPREECAITVTTLGTFPEILNSPEITPEKGTTNASK